MKKYFGELGQVLPKICLVFDSDDKTDSFELSRSFNLVFNPFLAIQNLNTQDSNFSKKLTRYTSNCKIVILTTLENIDFQKIKKLEAETTFIAYISFIEGKRCSSLISDLDFLSLIVTSDFKTYETLQGLNLKIPIRFVNLALDLQIYSNINLFPTGQRKKLLISKHCSAWSSINKTQIIESIELGQNLLAITLGDDFSISLFKEADSCRVKNRSIHENLDSGTINQILLGTSDIYLCSNLDHLGIFSAYANSARVKLTHLHKLESENNRDNSLLCGNDFRKAKYSYIKTFFRSIDKVNINDNILVEVPNDAGFFAFFNNLISVKYHWEGLHGFDCVIPDWSSASMSKFWKSSKFTSYCYAGVNEGNIFYDLFEHTENFKPLSASKYSVQKLNNLYAHSPNFSADPYLTYVWQDQLYRSSAFDEWRMAMHETLGDLVPRNDLLERIDKVFSPVGTGDYVIGVHIRHPSHAKEQPDLNLPSIENYIAIVEALIKKSCHSNVKNFIYVASDQEEVIVRFLREFGENMLYQSGLDRVSVDNLNKYHEIEQNNKFSDGHQIQHIRATDKSTWSKKLAEDVIMEAWALSRSNILIHSVSNVATAALYINPNLYSLPIRTNDSLESAQARQYLNEITSII
jgi:hypothetical protein